MGGLFSSDNPRPAENRFQEAAHTFYPYQNEDYLRYRQILERQKQRSREMEEEIRRQSANRYRTTLAPSNEVQRLSNQFSNLSLEPTFFRPIPVKTNTTLANTLSGGNIFTTIYKTELLHEHEYEFKRLAELFRRTNKKCFKITKIEKVSNPYLLAQYNLKKLEYTLTYGRCGEKELFHGTKLENIDVICKENFNWRLKGTAKGHKFGQGVSFTPISNYATNYGDKSVDKVMIMAKVLICSVCTGCEYMIIPPESYDTSAKEDEHVFVKYEDNTFYPSYIIYYSGFDPTKNNNNNRRRYQNRRIQPNFFIDFDI